MIRNYVLTAWRNFLRQREYSILNVSGLAIGLACCIIILLYVKNEYSYDRFHSQSERTFRVVQYLPQGEGWAWTGGVMPSIMKSEFKEVEKVVSIHVATSWNAKRPQEDAYTDVSYQNERDQNVAFQEDRIFFTEPSFFDVFDFPIVAGTVGASLQEPNKVLITEAMAHKYFGQDDPIGKTLKFNEHPLTVTAVLKDIPSNSHLQFDFLTSFATFNVAHGLPANTAFTSHWWPSVWTYVVLDKEGSAEEVNAKLPAALAKHRPAEEAKIFKPQLQALRDIHLYSHLANEASPNGNITHVYIFLTIAFFTLTLACINFTNLATARAVIRAKEIGVRKGIGAQRLQLTTQFFSESMLLNLVALLIAVLLADLLIPSFNLLLDQHLVMDLLHDRALWLIMIAIVVMSSVFSSCYPAVYLSGLKPTSVLKGSGALPAGRRVRRVLVVFQFALSALLIFCTSVAYWQVQYLRDADLGFTREQILLLRMGPTTKGQYTVLRDKLQMLPSVTAAAGTSARPGIDAGWGPQLDFEGADPNERPFIFQQFVDDQYFQALNVPVVAGRVFAKEYHDEGKSILLPGDVAGYESRNYVINETAAAYLGKSPEEAIGMPLRLYTEENGQLYSETKGMVVGVIKDFHTADLHDKIKPTVFSPIRSDFGPEQLSFMLIKLAPGKFSETLPALEETWKEINPQARFDYSFLDEDLHQQYVKERQLGNVVGIFALVTIAISCFGLFGLSAYTAETRTKEIGIRKVLGASEGSVVGMLSKDYIRLVLVAVLVAMPLGWWLMTQWLNQFPYRLSLQLWMFVSTGGVAVVVALATVSFQSVKAARTNPVKALRSE